MVLNEIKARFELKNEKLWFFYIYQVYIHISSAYKTKCTEKGAFL